MCRENGLINDHVITEPQGKNGHKMVEFYHKIENDLGLSEHNQVKENDEHI